jgi:dTDP-4-dehydrorhamnose 3,5-epimerase
MKLTPLGIEGAWLVESPIWSDDRGFFREWFTSKSIEQAVGHEFNVEQANISSSLKGSLRGIHYSLAANAQAKWVTCVSGLIKDIIVDIRPNSKTYRNWIEIELSGTSGNALLIDAGLGHGFVSLADVSTVAYLLSSPYSPSEEFEINPFDPALAINWGIENSKLIFSDKDRNAPTLHERAMQGKLPSF